MSKKRKKSNFTEVPQIGEPLENPNFVTPTALTDPRNYGTEPFPGAAPVPTPEPVPVPEPVPGEDLFPAPGSFPERADR